MILYLYRFIDENNQIIYVGKTVQNLRDRFRGHYHLPEECYEQTVKIEYATLYTEADLGIYEIYYINKLKPVYNTDFLWDGELSIVLPELEWVLYESTKDGVVCLKHSTRKYKEEKKQRKDPLYKKKDISLFLSQIEGQVMLQLKDRKPLIEKLNVRNKKRKRLSSLVSLNTALEEMKLPYRIKSFCTTRSKDGKVTKYKSAWKVQYIEEVA